METARWVKQTHLTRIKNSSAENCCGSDSAALMHSLHWKSESVLFWGALVTLHSSTGTGGFAMVLLMHSESPRKEGDGSDERSGTRPQALPESSQGSGFSRV